MYGYYNTGWTIIVAIIAALVGAILTQVIVAPDEKREGFAKGGKKGLLFLHDLVNFNKLYVESILKFLYIFLSIYIFVQGICLLLAGGGFGAFLTAILGPIGVRLSFELIMMVFVLVKNVISINKNVRKLANDTSSDGAAPVFADVELDGVAEAAQKAAQKAAAKADELKDEIKEKKEEWKASKAEAADGLDKSENND